MRILLLTQWFEPEPAFKGLGFAKALRDAGHHVQVLTGFPNYPRGSLFPGYRLRLFQREAMDGVEVIRVPLYPSHDQSALRRGLNYASFALSAAFLGSVLVRKPDVIYVYHPPATVAFPALVLKIVRGARVVYDIQDLWPDTLRATGMVRSAKLLGFVDWWCRLVYRCVDHIVVLSKGFQAVLIQRGVSAARVSVVLNWAGEEVEPDIPGQVDSLRTMAGLEESDKVVLYAGNIGRAQNLIALLPALVDPAVGQTGLKLLLMGDGVERAEIEAEVRRLQLENVVLLPPVPRAVVRRLVTQADALLVHLRSDPLFSITVPSKVQSYLYAGVPIIAGLTGDARAILERSNSALFFEPSDSDGFRRALLNFAGLATAERERMGRCGKSYYAEELSFSRALHQTSEVISRLQWE
jgi:glycosyltransferase involved in cell wall biosynthesis